MSPGYLPHLLNYVKFNGDEIWRIIGVFDVEDENSDFEEMVKLVRNESLGNRQWNNSGRYWKNSSICIYLNNEFYNLIDSAHKNLIDTTK